MTCQARDNLQLTSFHPSAWWRPTDSVEVGMSGGVFWFSGAGFDTFRRIFLEPIRVDVKPLALLADIRTQPHPEWLELLSIRAGLVIIPKGFRAEDFGADPGTFQTGREELKSFSIFGDAEPLVRYLRKSGWRAWKARP
jgi:hypothetical protein